MFPLERLFAASDELIRISKRLSHKDNREAIAMLLLSAATVACLNDFSKQEFLRGVEIAWRTAEGA
jgi:hypothetical protein